MKVITGASGFIGSCMLGHLNQNGISDIILVDDFSNPDKNKNLNDKDFVRKIHRDEFIKYLSLNHQSIDFIYHLGARTDTAETDLELFNRLNLNYSKEIWKACTQFKIPLIYASSAATYGNGNLGFKDEHHLIPLLKPLNAYADSKNDFDKWVLKQSSTPPLWFGLKFFNVFGPNEYHKSKMASVILHAFKQIISSDKVQLFKSHHPDIEDGNQKRDFIYIKDLFKVIDFLSHKNTDSGIYNIGTGLARSYYDLANIIFDTLNKTPQIDFIETPLAFRKNYQYFTEASLVKLKSIGYTESFYTLEEGISDYILNYLRDEKYY